MPQVTRRAPGSPLGLVPFLVPHWPSRSAFDDLVAAIATAGCAAIELALPASSWSPATGSFIAEALQATHLPIDEVLPIANQIRPSIAVVYRSTIEQFGRDSLLDIIAPAFDHVMLEDQGDASAAWIDACHARGLGWIEVCAVDRVDRRTAEELAARLPRDGSLYLTLASATGSASASSAALAEAVAAVRECRSDLVISTGFGITSPAQVARLAEIAELDSVAVGTELMRCLQRDAHEAGEYYAALVTAAGDGDSHATI